MTSAKLLWTWAAAVRHFEALEDRMTIEDGYIRVSSYPVLYDPMWDWPEYKAVKDWFNALPEERKISRPKDQDRDEPATPPGSQTRTLAWTGYTLTVRELRSWIDQLPNDAVLIIDPRLPNGGRIEATWEIT